MQGQSVVADTGPLRYLIQIHEIAVLPGLFGDVAVPATVAGELQHPGAPAEVRIWAARPPSWLSVHDDPAEPDLLPGLDFGERTAIALGLALGAGLLLMDDRAGVAAARACGLRVTGTVGLPIDAARRGLLDLDDAFSALRATNFRFPSVLFDALLEEERRSAGRT